MLTTKIDNFNEEILNEVIDILQEYNFFEYSDASDWWYREENHRYFTDNTGIHVEFGCTKAVFLSDSDWVLKTNIKRDTCDKYEDYCRREADNYELATHEHIDNYFAACYFYKEVDGYDFYIQERIDPDEDSISSSCYDYISSRYSKDFESIEDEDERNYRIDDAFYDMSDEERIYAVFCDYPTDIIDAIVTFISDLDINDLHPGNFGYRESRPVIMDYSGFN